MKEAPPRSWWKVQSTPGAGSTFTIFLPIRADDRRQAA